MNSRLARDGHLLDLDVDALLRGELSLEHRNDVEGHALACISCRRRVDKGDDDYRSPLPPLKASAGLTPQPAEPAVPTGSPAGRRTVSWKEFSKPQNESRPPKPATTEKSTPVDWKRQAPTLLLLAGVLVVIIFMSSSGDDTSAQEVSRAPSTFSLRVYREREGSPERLLDSSTARIGDRLDFEVSTPKSAPLLIFSTNGQGEVKQIFPKSGVVALEMASGNQPVPGSLTLSGGPGVERIIALSCPEGMVIAEATALAGGVPESGKTPSIWPDCDQSIVRLKTLL